MDFKDLVQNRYSCRGYSDKEIPREVIQDIISDARLAPSACNLQPWHFVVVDDAELIKKVAEETKSSLIGINKFVSDAKALIVIVRESSSFAGKIASIMSHRDYTPYDIGIVSATITYSATEHGVGSCILGWYKEEAIKPLLNVPKDKKIELIISLGYPQSEEIPNKKRKSLESMLSYNSYSKGE